MFENRDTVMALFAVLGAILWIIYMVVNQRNIGALTAALKETKSDTNLIDQAHTLAIDVVSVETLHKALDIIHSFSSFIKTIAPQPVDDAIDAADDLAAAVVNDTPATIKGIPVTPIPPATFQQPNVPRGEDRELAQQ